MITPILSLIYAGNQMIEHSSQSELMAPQHNGSKVIQNHKQNNGVPKSGLKVMQNIHR